MKSLPNYMENGLKFIAEKVAQKGIASKEDAYKVMRDELINESISAKANPGPAKPVIVLVEDDPDLNELYVEQLTDMGFEVKSYFHWKDAKISPTDLILHDGNGVGEKPANLTNTCVSMTGDSGAEADLYKPFSKKQLQDVLAAKSKKNDVVSKNPGISIQRAVDQLLKKGHKPKEIVSILAKYGYRASEKGITDYSKKLTLANPSELTAFELVDDFIGAAASLFVKLFIFSIRSSTVSEFNTQIGDALQRVQKAGPLAMEAMLKLPPNERTEIMKRIEEQGAAYMVHVPTPETYDQLLRFWKFFKDLKMKDIHEGIETDQDVMALYHKFIRSYGVKKSPRLSSGYLLTDFEPLSLRKGLEVEMEHTDDEVEAIRIAMDHLVEDPKYYEKLEKCGITESTLVATNPTKKSFLEIYNVGARLFNDAPIGKFLGKVPSDKFLKFGKDLRGVDTKTASKTAVKYFEILRNLSVNTADTFIENILGYGSERSKFIYDKKKGRNVPVKLVEVKSKGHKAGSYQYLPKVSTTTGGNLSYSEIPSKKKIDEDVASEKDIIEHRIGGLAESEVGQSITRIEELRESLKHQYMKLMIESIVFGICTSIFYANKEKITDLLEQYLVESGVMPKQKKIREMSDDDYKPLKAAYTEKEREAFTAYVIEKTMEKVRDGSDPFSK